MLVFRLFFRAGDEINGGVASKCIGKRGGRGFVPPVMGQLDQVKGTRELREKLLRPFLHGIAGKEHSGASILHRHGNGGIVARVFGVFGLLRRTNVQRKIV